MFEAMLEFYIIYISPYADKFNAALELCGAFVIFLNIKKTYIDKSVRGIDWRYLAFYIGWGAWNMFYYPSLGQWWSFYAGILIIWFDVIWLAQIWYYNGLEKNKRIQQYIQNCLTIKM
jgi:hypothetical protein